MSNDPTVSKSDSDTPKIPMWSRTSDVRNLVLTDACPMGVLLNWLYPDEVAGTVWWVLGSSLHKGIELTIANDLSYEDGLYECELEYDILLNANRKVGTIESTSARRKRSLETAPEDMKRMFRTWWNGVHPSSPDRHHFYDDYDWPPRVEYMISVPSEVERSGAALYTEVDAIFEGGPEGRPVAIVDWKGLALDTPLPTVGGWVDMKTIEVGDVLFDIEGNPTAVMAVSEVHYGPTYRITFDDGSFLVADDKHQWLVRWKTDRPQRQISTVEMADRLAKGLKVMIETTVLRIPDLPLPLDPYVLGIWLGDGRCTSGELTNFDEEIWGRLAKLGYPTRTNKTTRTLLGLRTKLRAVGVLGVKHIPTAYRRAGNAHRLALLQGLMDSDGTWNRHRQQAVYETTDQHMAGDVADLVRSLGDRAYEYEDNHQGFGLTVRRYRVTWTPNELNPFRLSRKASLVRPGGTGYSGRHYVRSVERIADEPTRCIVVDSSTRTYLAGERMIATHNSGSSKTADPAQLHIYRYGLYMEDLYERANNAPLWFPESAGVAEDASATTVGWFHHLDMDKLQIVAPYIGNTVVRHWLTMAAAYKRAMIEKNTVVATNSYLCRNYNNAQRFCPVCADDPTDVKAWPEILGRTERAVLLDAPEGK